MRVCASFRSSPNLVVVLQYDFPDKRSSSTRNDLLYIPRNGLVTPITHEPCTVAKYLNLKWQQVVLAVPSADSLHTGGHVVRSGLYVIPIAHHASLTRRQRVHVAPRFVQRPSVEARYTDDKAAKPASVRTKLVTYNPGHRNLNLWRCE